MSKVEKQCGVVEKEKFCKTVKAKDNHIGEESQQRTKV